MNQDNRSHQLVVPPSQHDHYQGLLSAPVVLVNYGNYQCPQCGEVHQLIQAAQHHFDIAFPDENWLCVVFRHFIEHSIYPQAQKVAEAVEAASAQGQFWHLHDMLFLHQEALEDGYLVEYADRLGLNISQFLQSISKRVHFDRINQNIDSAYRSGVTTAPALFINGIRYRNRWNIEQLIAAITAARH